jgi:hypothetical protein
VPRQQSFVNAQKQRGRYPQAMEILPAVAFGLLLIV